MRPIKYSETVKCDHHNYGCKEASCPLNVLHVPSEPFFTVLDIPHSVCLYTLDMIANEKLDIAIRVWVEDVFVKKKRRSIPPEISKLLKRNGRRDVSTISSPL